MPEPGDFEKYKYKVELFKWLIGSVALVVMTTIIDWGFKDRAAGLQELEQYDKYATELIVLNNDPVKKRMLAQFFSKVTPSEKLRQGWEKYYLEVNAEYRKFLRDDSIARDKLKRLKTTENLSPVEKEEKEKLEIQVNETRRIINQPIILPDKAVVPVVYIHIGREEIRDQARELTAKIVELGYKAPGIELIESARNLKQNEIRYFRQSDEAVARILQEVLADSQMEAKVNPVFRLSSQAREGTIEILLK